MELEMGGFWDARAEENPFFFIDNRLDYRHPDLEAFWREGERDLDHLLDTLGVAVGLNDRVLEIGCGVGRLTRVLAARAATVLALDVSARMLELARRCNPELENVEWIVGDGSTLGPVPAQSVDACVSHVVFQHIPSPSVTLDYVREIGRVLRPDGWAALQISNDPRAHRNPPLRRRATGALLARLGRGPQGQDDPRWRGSMVALEDLRNAAQDGGLRIERVVGAGSQMCAVLARRAAVGAGSQS